MYYNYNGIQVLFPGVFAIVPTTTKPSKLGSYIMNASTKCPSQVKTTTKLSVSNLWQDYLTAPSQLQQEKGDGFLFQKPEKNTGLGQTSGKHDEEAIFMIVNDEIRRILLPCRELLLPLHRQLKEKTR